METNTKSHHRSQRKGILAGIILILLGLLFFIDGAFKPVIISWQMLLVVIGLLSLNRRYFLWGTFLIIIGGFLLIPRLATAFPANFEWVKPDFISQYWALLVVAAGVLLIIHRLCFKPDYHFFPHLGKPKTSSASKDGFLERNLIFSGTEEIFLEPVFTGGDLNTVFGGASIDLRKTSLPEGVTTLEINAVFGGVNLLVPDSWKVEVRITGIFGGATDSRKINETEMDASRKLVINGQCVFGGCEIRSTDHNKYEEMYYSRK